VKRIIDGVTYNTDTSTIIASNRQFAPEWGNRPEETIERSLYKTRGGAFFIVITTQTTKKNIYDDWEPVERIEFAPVTRDYAQDWVSKGEVEVFDDSFGEFPEAAEEALTSATVYIRMPTSLKARLEALAERDGVSLNAWMMRCAEGCAQQASNSTKA
jgi:hypothetical protein